jgi:catechol 2,3-dioxygenase-like lactoylglutathione lyase family enzyme
VSPPVVGLDHAFLTIPEGGESEARRFYGDMLGLEEIERPAGIRRSGGVWFRVGASEVHLGTDDAHFAPRRPHPGLRVAGTDALDDLAAKLAENGYDVAWDARIEGRKRFYTRDPFGNRVELLADP